MYWTRGRWWKSRVIYFEVVDLVLDEARFFWQNSLGHFIQSWKQTGSSQWRFLGLFNYKLFMGLFSSTFWTYNPFKSIQEENSRRLPVRGESTTSQGLRKHETTVYHKIQTCPNLSASRFCLFHTFERIIQRSTGRAKSGTQLLTSNKICSSENFSISKLFCQAVKNSSRQ